jgi:demethylmenaquinone methyltransferase/2-methoxy-6-polyprenyl-1,4-benzoquinol methylase
VRTVFGRIAARYDLMNRLMTGGQDVVWRREMIRQARLSSEERLLDLGSGTGDLAREAMKQVPAVRVIAADFALEMMQIGKKKGALNWCAADALSLPFPSGTFDAVVSGFLMRNVGDLPRALQEQFRVLKSGGRMVILETTRPQPSLFSPMIWLYMHLFIPILGGIVSGFKEAYTYLPDSTESFLSVRDLADRLRDSGFNRVVYRTRMLGTIAIHVAVK